MASWMQYTQPEQGKYGRCESIALGKPIQATFLPEVSHTNNALFGKPAK